MSEGAISIKKAIPIIVVTWILSLVTTLALVYVAPSIFPPINTANISDEAVVSGKIADGAIITTKLADGTVTSAKILDGTITASEVADGSIIAVKIADGAVTTVKIADGGISSGKIANDAVVTIKLADGAVTTAKILDGTITALDLANGAITEFKIAEGAVTESKIADNAVTNIKLASQAIPFAWRFSSVVEATIFTPSTWIDMPGMSATLTVNRTSYFLIMFSTEAKNTDPSQTILVQATINGSVAIPGLVNMTPKVGLSDTHRHTLDYSTYAFNFIAPSTSAGTYTIKIEWFIWGGMGYARSRTLTVIALPE